MYNTVRTYVVSICKPIESGRGGGKGRGVGVGGCGGDGRKLTNISFWYLGMSSIYIVYYCYKFHHEPRRGTCIVLFFIYLFTCFFFFHFFPFFFFFPISNFFKKSN